jgi:hypothetical protein
MPRSLQAACRVDREGAEVIGVVTITYNLHGAKRTLLSSQLRKELTGRSGVAACSRTREQLSGLCHLDLIREKMKVLTAVRSK